MASTLIYQYTSTILNPPTFTTPGQSSTPRQPSTVPTLLHTCTIIKSSNLFNHLRSKGLVSLTIVLQKFQLKWTILSYGRNYIKNLYEYLCIMCFFILSRSSTKMMLELNKVGFFHQIRVTPSGGHHTKTILVWYFHSVAGVTNFAVTVPPVTKCWCGTLTEVYCLEMVLYK